MTVSRIIFQDALVTITEINNADTVAVGAVGYWEVVEAQYAAGTPQANATVIRTSVENYLRQIETWLAANPNGGHSDSATDRRPGPHVGRLRAAHARIVRFSRGGYIMPVTC